jgi:hypothetical protein
MSEPKAAQQHYLNGVDLLTCIGQNKDSPDFTTQHAEALALSAIAQALLGLLKLQLGSLKFHD